MCNETFKDSVWCEIQLKKSKLLVGVCYRVPDATEEANQGMYKLLERANKETSMIMGYFNYHIDLENSEGEREQYRLFMDFIEASFMQQHVMEPIRGDNILDLVITSDVNMIENVSVGNISNRAVRRSHCVGGGAPFNFGRRRPPVPKNRRRRRRGRPKTLFSKIH